MSCSGLLTFPPWCSYIIETVYTSYLFTVFLHGFLHTHIPSIKKLWEFLGTKSSNTLDQTCKWSNLALQWILWNALTNSRDGSANLRILREDGTCQKTRKTIFCLKKNSWYEYPSFHINKCAVGCKLRPRCSHFRKKKHNVKQLGQKMSLNDGRMIQTQKPRIHLDKCNFSC